jgi:hypothetical protein
VAAHSSAPLPLPHACRLSRRALPPPLHAPSPAAPRARPSHMCRSLPRRLSVRLPSLSRAALTPPWPLGHMCRGALGLPWPSQGHPRAQAVLVGLTRCGSSLAPTRRLESANPGSPLTSVAYVYFKCFTCFRCMLQLFHLELRK